MHPPKILVPVDHSPTCDKTLKTIAELRRQFTTVLTLLHVVDTDRLDYKMIPNFQLDLVRQNALKAGEALLRRQAAILQAAGIETEVRLETGFPRQTIPRIANDEGFDLLVIGRHDGTGEIRDVLFGSVANYVLHNVRCPVLLF